VDLLKAVQLLWQRGRRCAVVLAGPEMPNFQRFWKAFTPRGRVLRLGVLDAGQKRDFFAGIDLFALPSRSDSFGIVLLEAWANGTACVGYRAGGIAEVIRDGVDGLLARCGAIEELTSALEQLVLDMELRRSFGEAGRKRVELDFQWPDKLRRVEEVYAEVIAERKDPRAKARGSEG
jgi:glycosyltransferase involved in cell wall biosynthesis